jgi:S-adenosylmethionine uptake transporter
MLQGVSLGFLTYLLFSLSDASIKATGPSLPVFEINFFITLFAFATFAVGKPAAERWRDMFRMNRPWLILVRSVTGITGGVGAAYAFTTLPFAEAYSLLFLMPTFATLLAIPILGERIGWRRWVAVGIGFAGVLLVVRPGFRDLHLGHLTAAISAFSGGISLNIIRKVGHTEKRISLLGVVYTIALFANGIAMAPFYKPPSLENLAVLIFAGLVGGLGQITLIAATRRAPANRVAPAQYSQIIWAVVFGAALFHEYPDRLTYFGLALVALSGLLTFLREEQLHGWSRRSFLFRNRDT